MHASPFSRDDAFCQKKLANSDMVIVKIHFSHFFLYTLLSYTVMFFMMMVVVVVIAIASSGSGAVPHVPTSVVG